MCQHGGLWPDLKTVGCSHWHFRTVLNPEKLVASGRRIINERHGHLEKLRRDAAECAIIRDLATDPKKRELFTKLAEHMSVLASEVERAIAKDTEEAASVGAPPGHYKANP